MLNLIISVVRETANIVSDMIRLSINALKTKETEIISKLYTMDNSVDALYRNYLRELIMPKNDSNNYLVKDPKCAICTLLILRYLERIADHACYIGDSVHYIVTGHSSPRK